MSHFFILIFDIAYFITEISVNETENKTSFYKIAESRDKSRDKFLFYFNLISSFVF